MSLVLSRVFKTTLQQRHRQAHKRRRFSLFSFCTDCSLFLEGSLSDLHRAPPSLPLGLPSSVISLLYLMQTFPSTLLSTLVHFFHFPLSDVIWHNTSHMPNPPSHTLWYLFLVNSFMKDYFMSFIFFQYCFLGTLKRVWPKVGSK